MILSMHAEQGLTHKEGRQSSFQTSIASIVILIFENNSGFTGIVMNMVRLNWRLGFFFFFKDSGHFW